MSACRLALVAATLATTAGWAQKPIDYRLGDWKITYRAYAPASTICEAEPQWLYDELEQVNGMLDAFLVHGTTRGGAWGDQHLPLLAQAVKTLPPLVAVHEANLGALERCAFSRSGLYPKLLERGLKLVKEAHLELDKMPELVRFARHRGEVERWDKDRAAKQERAKETCPPEAAKPIVYFAWQDEYGTRVWQFCDGVVVRAPVRKPFEVEPAATKQAPSYVQAARSYPELAILKAPQQF